MPPLKAGVRGDKRLIEKLNEIPKEIAKVVKRELVVSGKIVESQAIRLMSSGGKTGRTYTVPGTKRKYTASAPGEAPAVATDNLKNNVISQETATKTETGFMVEVGTNIEYGAILELQKDRPWLSAALILTKLQNIRAMNNGIKIALQKFKKSNGSAA